MNTPTRQKKLGEACGGANIAECKRRWNLNDEGLETLACYQCEVDRI